MPSVTGRIHISPDERIARTASAQHGLVTHEQVMEAGLSYSALRHRVASGRLVKAGHRVYAVPGAPATWERSALAACLGAGRGAVLSHRSAATAWQFPLPGTEIVHIAVLARSSARYSTPGVQVHTTRSLSPVDRTTIGRLPVTTIARTLVDLAGGLEPEPLARVVEDVLGKRMVTPERVAEALGRAGMPRPGHRRLKEALGPWLSSTRHDSAAEGACRRILAGAGLPPPVAQYRVDGGDGFVARLDFAWPLAKVALEVDGFRYHANPGPHERDSRRANRLAALGWTVLRTTPAELEHSPAALLSALRRRLVAGG
jgi:hypothetical protein